MASGFIGNEVPGNRLRVRVPCPPLKNTVFWRCFFYALTLPPYQGSRRGRSKGRHRCSLWDLAAIRANALRFSTDFPAPIFAPLKETSGYADRKGE